MNVPGQLVERYSETLVKYRSYIIYLLLFYEV
jgi:hypothetical protein